jgi:hypothetical protein
LKKNKIIQLIAGLFLIYILWMGILLLGFRTYRDTTGEKSPLELQGAYHIHTIHSDGRRTTDKIAALASRSSLDFIILADHGNPNLESIATSGWKHNVLVLAGSELSVNRGHLVALGFTPERTPFSQNAETAFYQIKDRQGFAIIAHPYSKVSWSWGKAVGYNGIEIINANTMLKYDVFRIILLSPSLLIRPEYAMLKMLQRPDNNLKKWDELSMSHPTYGFYSVDAHLLYKPLLPLLQLHVLLKEPLSGEFEQASHQVLSALHQGRFYNAVDAAAQANGFSFWAQTDQKKALMGETIMLHPHLTLKVRANLPFSKEVRLIHNGKRVMSTTDSILEYQPVHPGFYRVEVYLKEKTPMHKDIPWILSNPIYIRENSQ